VPKAPICRQIQSAAVRCTLRGWTSNPRVGGSNPPGRTIKYPQIAISYVAPARLTIDQSQITPSTISYGTRSRTARFHVSACGGNAEGVLVYFTAVPYGQFAIPNEQATGSDGWATLEFRAQAGSPAAASSSCS
jgi:hypothetical protein